ncbi:hypothetical protein BH10ACT2_BH10ACT2_12370 [soil metagenome]
MRITKTSKVAAVLVGLALVAAACGDDKAKTDDTTADSTADTTADSTGGTTGDSTPAGDTAAMTVTYNLSDVAVWDDGSAFSLADFQCTLDATMNTPGSLSTTGYDQILSLANGDTDKDIVVTFKSLYAPWRLLFGGLLKAAATPDCSDVSAAFDGGISYSGTEWKIDSWSAESLTLVPNEGYIGNRTHDNGVNRVVFVPAEDGPTLLKSGAVDFIYPQAYTGIDAELADPNTDFQTAPSGAFEGFYFNSYSGPFADPILRAAFSMSIDRDAIYAQIYAPFAQGSPLLDCGPIAPGPYCDGDFANSYDPAGAEALLTDNGWTKNDDGFWVDADGKRPEIRWMVNTGNTRRESTQEFLIPLLRAAGFAVRADNCEALPCVFETRLPSLDYDMAMYINTVAPDPAYLRSWGCDQIPTEENGFQGQNSNGWCNEDATALLIQADAELDPDARIAEVKQVLAMMAEDHIMLPTLQFPNLGARRTDRVDNAYGEIANYRALNDWYKWTDVDGDGQIIVGAEQFPTVDCPNPVTECANSSWYVWLVAFPVLPGMYDTTNDQTIVPSEFLTGEATVVAL